MRLSFAISFMMGLSFCFGPQALAQNAGDLKVLTKKEEEARKKTAKLESEQNTVRQDISKLKAELSKSAIEVQTISSELSSLEKQTNDLTQRAQSLKAGIDQDKIRYVELLAAIQRLEASPPPALILSPREAKKASQAGILMNNLSVQLKDRADALNLNLTALSVTQTQIQNKQADLKSAQTRLTNRQADVKKGLSKKHQLEARLSDETSQAAKEAERLAAESKSLVELIAKLEAESKSIIPRQKPKRGGKASKPVTLPKGTKRFAEAKGGMINPISGTIVKRFGRGEKGMTISSRQNEQVLAPYAGRVEFSGPFKNYDNVIILNVGDGYFVLLTGLERLNVSAGERVKRGEPVGAMPQDPNAELYIELRKNGSPVNPEPWLA